MSYTAEDSAGRGERERGRDGRREEERKEGMGKGEKGEWKEGRES